MSKITLITGATAGIGEACAHVFARERYDVIITGRRADRLEKLARQLKKEYNVNVLTAVFDVRDREEVISKLEALPDEWKKVNVLVNNAGLMPLSFFKNFFFRKFFSENTFKKKTLFKRILKGSLKEYLKEFLEEFEKVEKS